MFNESGLKIIAVKKFQVQTDAVVSQVTSRKNGNPSINGVSLNGGTLLWISGKS